MSEIIFEVTEDEIDGGYAARALGYGIHTQGDTLDELRQKSSRMLFRRDPNSGAVSS